MNSALQDLTHHLAVLRERLPPSSDYETAFNYFLEEFGGDKDFIALGEIEELPALLAVLNHIATQVLGKPVKLERARLSRVPGHGFHHGSAAVDGRVVILFYFEDANTGLMAIILGVRGAAEMARFRLPAALPVDPGRN